MLIYFIRHGESEGNLHGFHTGWYPVNLTEAGRAQAAATREMLKDVQFDRLYVSDVKRAQQTAEIIFPDMPRTFVTRAREINTSAIALETRDSMYKKYGELYLSCRANADYAPLHPDLEGHSHLWTRAGAFLTRLSKQPYERVAVVAHAEYIMTAAAWILGSEERLKPLACRNASVSVFEWTGSAWKILLWGATPQLP